MKPTKTLTSRKFYWSLFKTPWYSDSEPKPFESLGNFSQTPRNPPKPLKPYEFQWNDLKHIENALKITLVSQKLLANTRRSLWSALNFPHTSWNMLKRLVALLKPPWSSLQSPWNTTKPPLKSPEIVRNLCEMPRNPYELPVGSLKTIGHSIFALLYFVQCVEASLLVE